MMLANRLLVCDVAPRVRPVILAALVICLFPRATSASSITWEWTGLAAGTVFAVPVPSGTPFSIAVTFDSNAPNICGSASTNGLYSPFQATTRILGYQYSGFAGIESNENPFVPGGCGPNPGVAFRVFVNGNSGVQNHPWWRAASVRGTIIWGLLPRITRGGNPWRHSDDASYKSLSDCGQRTLSQYSSEPYVCSNY